VLWLQFHDRPFWNASERFAGETKMSLICVVCGKVIVMSDNPDHYGVCAACPSNNLTKQQQEKINRGFGK